jgi:hypothetical protein
VFARLSPLLFPFQEKVEDFPPLRLNHAPAGTKPNPFMEVVKNDTQSMKDYGGPECKGGDIFADAHIDAIHNQWQDGNSDESPNDALRPTSEFCFHPVK